MRALILVYCCLFNTAHAEVFTAKIIVVIDGDTVLVRRASGLVKIRLAEIDAPEKVQTLGETSKQSLASMVLGKQVNIKTQTIDKYGRLVAHISSRPCKIQFRIMPNALHSPSLSSRL
jgi:endonuclease YncB( thermonuclease family)